MATKTLKLASLKGLDTSARNAKLRELVAGRKDVNGELAALNARIAEYEDRYELPSSRLVEAVNRRSIRQTAEVCSWLTLVELRSRVGRQH
jgi:hypothetical protein